MSLVATSQGLIVRPPKRGRAVYLTREALILALSFAAWLATSILLDVMMRRHLTSQVFYPELSPVEAIEYLQPQRALVALIAAMVTTRVARGVQACAPDRRDMGRNGASGVVHLLCAIGVLDALLNLPWKGLFE